MKLSSSLHLLPSTIGSPLLTSARRISIPRAGRRRDPFRVRQRKSSVIRCYLSQSRYWQEVPVRIRMSSTCTAMVGADGASDDEQQDDNVQNEPREILSREQSQRLQNILDLLVLPEDVQKFWKPASILSCTHNFLSARGVQQHATTAKTNTNQANQDIAVAALAVRQEFHRIESSTKKLAGRKALEEAALQLLAASSCQTSCLVATLLVGLSLALEGETSSRSAHRAISSAMGAALTKEQNGILAGTDRAIPHNIFAALFQEAIVTSTKDDKSTEVVKPNDWHIVSGLAKAMQVSCCNDVTMERNVVAVLSQSLGLDSNGDAMDATDAVSKSNAAASLAMAAQLQPWQLLEPKLLINTAIGYDLWHAAERICASAVKHGNDTSASEAVEALLEGSFEAKNYRQADTFATTFFESGGKRRFLEARYLHACSTIVKVIRKGALPVIDKQVDRVDKAAQKMREDGYSQDSDTGEFSITPLTAEEEIRTFTLQQLEETGNIDAAQRLATLWGVDFVHDEEAILAAQKARREKYLQWEDVLPGSPPDWLLSTPEALISAMQELQADEGKLGSHVFGFDTEWNEDDTGVDLLQIASLKRVLLVDIPTLSSTPEGVEALEKTIGRLFASSDCTKVGFSCRQDISKLRTTRTCHPKDKKKHWFSGSEKVMDLQTLVATNDPKLKRWGLSRVCEHYLGKPLDKSEQCSYWNARPLSLRQRTYAALDAWTVRAIYSKVVG